MKEKIINFYNTNQKLAVGIIIFLLLSLFGGVVLFFILRAPNPPSDLRVSVRGYDSVHLTWIDHQRADEYRIYRSQELEATYENVGVTANRHYLDTELNPETTYYYRITKVIGNKESDYSEEIHVTTEGIGAPTGLHAEEIGNDYIKLAWDGFRGSQGYVIYRTDSVERPYAEIATTNNNYYYDIGLENNKAYYYVVTQIIEGEESDYSRRELIATRDWVCGSSLTYDGESYDTILLGEHCWFKDNLNYETQTGSWCYDDNSSNCNNYGRLYDWETMMNGSTQERSQGVCPQSWRVPSDEDFKILERYLGMARLDSNNTEWRGEGLDIGDIMKVSTECTEEGRDYCGSSGFNVLLGGTRRAAGAYMYDRVHTFLWTSTSSNDNAWRRMFSIENSGVHRETTSKRSGLYVRCVKDE